MSNVDARTYNTQIKPEMVDTGVRESRDSSEHPETTPIIIALDVTGSMRRTPHEMIKDNFPKLMDALMQLGIKDPQLLFMAVGDHEYDNYHIHVTNGSYGTRIAPGWKDLLGQNVLTCDSHNIHNVIAEAIRQHEDLTGIPYEATAVAPTSTGKESGTYTY